MSDCRTQPSTAGRVTATSATARAERRGRRGGQHRRPERRPRAPPRARRPRGRGRGRRGRCRPGRAGRRGRRRGRRPAREVAQCRHQPVDRSLGRSRATAPTYDVAAGTRGRAAARRPPPRCRPGRRAGRAGSRRARAAGAVSSRSIIRPSSRADAVRSATIRTRGSSRPAGSTNRPHARPGCRRAWSANPSGPPTPVSRRYGVSRDRRSPVDEQAVDRLLPRGGDQHVASQVLQHHRAAHQVAASTSRAIAPARARGR